MARREGHFVGGRGTPADRVLLLATALEEWGREAMGVLYKGADISTDG